MTIHVVTSPGIISRKNTKRYLSEHLIFPETVTSIEEEAFMRQPCIKKITFPEGLEHIGARAFQDCIHLQTLDLPDSLTAFDKEAFHGCNHLKVLEIAHEPRYIGERVVNRSTKIRCYKNSKVDVYCQKNQILAEYIEK